MRRTSAAIGLVLITGALALAPSATLAVCEQQNAGIFGFPKHVYTKDPCVIDSLNQVFIVATNILSLLLGLVATLFALFMLINGFQYITSGGSQDRAKRAREGITNAVIGLIISLAAFGVILLLANGLGGNAG